MIVKTCLADGCRAYPCFGFGGKTTAQRWACLAHRSLLRSSGLPMTGSAAAPAHHLESRPVTPAQGLAAYQPPPPPAQARLL